MARRNARVPLTRTNRHFYAHLRLGPALATRGAGMALPVSLYDYVVEGEIALRDRHCTFRWFQNLANDYRVADVEERHCPECIAELERMGFVLNDARTGSTASNP